jgi:hypothetical protein
MKGNLDKWSFANIEADGAGKLRTIIQVSHLLLDVGNAIARWGEYSFDVQSTNPTYVNILLSLEIVIKITIVQIWLLVKLK